MSENLKKNLNCGSCNYLLREKTFNERCVELGKIPTSKSCSSHSPDVFTLVNSEPKVQTLSILGEVLAQFSANDIQILGALCLGEKTTRKYGYKFKQKVYIRIRGASNANYRSNFVVGYILDVTKDTIRVIGESGTLCISAINDKNSETVYTTQRFAPILLEMRDKKAYVDPSIVVDDEKVKRRVNNSILPLDVAADEGILDRKALKKQKVKDDLISLVSRMGRGQMKSKKSNSNENEEVSVNWHGS